MVTRITIATGSFDYRPTPLTNPENRPIWYVQGGDGSSSEFYRDLYNNSAGMASAVYEEAENMRRFLASMTPEVPLGDVVLVPLVEPTGPTVDELTSQLAMQVALRTKYQYDQIRGDDPRLSDFWEEAHRVADKAGHCQIFDELCEALGGPRRTVPGVATVSVRLTVSISVPDINNVDIEDWEVKEAISNNIDIDGWDVKNTEAY